MNDEIGFVCDVCGAHDDVPSIVTMLANYGSVRDTGQDGTRDSIKVPSTLDRLERV